MSSVHSPAVFLSGQINCLGIYCCPFGLRSLTINKSVNCVRIHNRTYLLDASSRTHNSRLMRNFSLPGHYPRTYHVQIKSGSFNRWPDEQTGEWTEDEASAVEELSLLFFFIVFISWRIVFCPITLWSAGGALASHRVTLCPLPYE